VRALSLAVATALAASAALAPLAAAAPPAGAYKAPRTAFGQPDIGGYWSNASLTPMQRDSKLGDRLADTIPGSRLVRLPGTGRLVPEEAPETLTNMILEFVGAAGMVARTE